MNENILPQNPMHIGIIMDGNGRWAKKRGLPRNAGHVEGVNAFKRIVNDCIDIGISYATFYVFSTENWKRPKSEIDALMNLFEINLGELEKMSKKDRNMRVRFIGDLSVFPEKMLKRMENIEEKSGKNTGLCCILAINYGGRQDIVNAANKLYTAGKEITESDITENLYTKGIPDVDLVIRTAGEQRLSNFLIWQSAYAEYYFTDTAWPDFKRRDLEAALDEFKNRSRRFGGLSPAN